MAKGPLLVFKKGICKHSDAAVIRRAAPAHLTNFIKAVCDDWGVPVITARFVNRPSARYYGLFNETTFKRSKMTIFEIEINSIAYYEGSDSLLPFHERVELIDTILHELAHYIDRLMNGSTDHTQRFYDIMQTLKSMQYEKALNVNAE